MSFQGATSGSRARSGDEECPEQPSDHDPLLRIEKMSKRFAGTRALSDVDLEVRPGEIHALVGGNGSGKSTLIKILAGVYQSDEGTVEVAGVRSDAASMTPALSHQMGLRIVHQDLGVFPDLSVTENLSLGRGFETGAGGHIRWRQARERAAELIERFEIPASPRTMMGRLSRAAQTQVAIARALQDQQDAGSGLLVLDEPTASLPVHEVNLLMKSLRRYAAKGQSMLYVSHRLDEILSLSDRVTVLRDGVQVGTWDTTELDESRLIELIVGRKVEQVFLSMPEAGAASPVLQVEDLWAGPLRGLSLQVRRGEVVGVAGLLGSGRSELLHAIFGNLPIDRGTVRVADEPVAFERPADAMNAGVALVPENRAADAAFIDMPVYENMTAAVTGSYYRGLRMRARAMRRDADTLMRDFRVKAASSQAPLNTLSGGNQQKVIMARWLRREPQLLLLDEPTQGVDVGARADIYAVVRDAVNDGAGALVVASDFEELAHVVDRAVVLRDGVVVAEVRREDLSAQRLTELSYANNGRRNGNGDH